MELWRIRLIPTYKVNPDIFLLEENKSLKVKTLMEGFVLSTDPDIYSCIGLPRMPPPTVRVPPSRTHLSSFLEKMGGVVRGGGGLGRSKRG
uniref:Uncharacterized protein n=1 Tax=Vespula pensylvanica TaxID=30213 RepID=A0A834KMB9_VESPE|nr:hypothetical protein H0235_014044 [Vespula pensylvanica]